MPTTVSHIPEAVTLTVQYIIRKSMNLSTNEARDVAQNRPLWRMM